MIASGLVVDITAPKQNQANIEKARNDIPVVNIVAPNQSGLSHNKFSDYNVNKEGLILNNSNKREVNTQLAGYIYGNENLKNSNTAKTILNEVTSKNKTHLNGFTEVAGDRANVVVANPNGIYINGAGFINTSKATITTGNPNIQNGTLNGFDVKDGQIDIDGEGLNTSNINKAELYANAVKINAKIYANDLDIVTGQNSISKDGTITNIENSTDEKPILSLDSSTLGGIYANKISLIGTQKGVGVNLPIEITAQDDFKLTADGKIVLDKVVAEKNINIKSTSSDVNSNTVYANNVNIEAKENIKNDDSIASKTNIDLKAKTIINENLIASGVDKDLKDTQNGNLSINSQALQNKKILYAKDNITINSNNINGSKNSSIVAKNDISIKANEVQNEDNTILQANNNLELDTLNFKANSSKIQASNIYIKSDNIETKNSKILSQDGNILLNSKNLILNNSELSASKYLYITTDNLKNISGYIEALKDINITAKNIYNQDGVIVTNENLTINSQNNGTFNNQNGILKANKDLILYTSLFKGDNSKLQAQNIDIKANDFKAKSSNIVATNGNLDIKSNSLDLDNSLQIASLKDINIFSNQAKLNNSKIVSQNGDITLNSNDLELNSSNVTSLKKVDIKSDNLKNQNGNIQALKDINITSKNVDNSNGVIVSNENLTINSSKDGFFNNIKGILQTGKDLVLNIFNIKADNSILQASNIDIKANNIEAKNSNIIATNGNLDIKANSLNLDNSLQIGALDNISIISNEAKLNNSKILSQDGNISFDTNSLELNKSVVNASKYLDINTISLKNISGYIEALKDINITVKNMDNQDGVIVTNEDLTINSQNNGTFNNQNGILKANKDLILYTSLFKGDNSKLQAQNIDIKANDFKAKSSNIVATNGNLDIKSNSLDLDNSLQIASLKDINIFSNQAKLNNSKIVSQNGDITLNSNDLELNSSNVTSLKKVDIKSDNLKNQNGNIQALKDINITSKNVDNSNGVIVSNENLTINSSKDGFFNNIKGILQTGKDLVLNIFNIKADNSILQASNIDIKANNLEAKNSNIVAINDNLGIETNSFIFENSYLQAKNNLNLKSKNTLNLKDNTIVANNLNLSADEINLDGTSQTKNILLSTNDILINTKKLMSNYLFTQSNNDININSSNIDLKNSKLQSVAFIGSNYANGYKQGNINLTTSNLNLYNTNFASKDINIKNQDNKKLQNFVIENSSLDVNNDINIATLNLSSKASKYLSSNNLFLNTDNSVVFLNNSFSGNNVNLAINENLILDKSNSFLAQNNLNLTTKSLVNNAQFISNGNLTINTNDFIVNNALLSSKNSINLNATNYILNNDSNEQIFGIRGAFTNLNTKLLTNYGFISSLYDMNIKVTDLINYAGIASANSENKASNMTVEANNFTNYNTVYSNDNINLYVKNSLKNITDKTKVNLGNEKATIFATNNITMQGNKEKSLRTDEIINDKSIIQTRNGDINIFAKKLENLSSDPEVKGELIQGSSPYIKDGTRINTEIIARDSSGNTYNSYKIYTDIMDFKSYEYAQIISGKNMSIDANSVLNKYSLISTKNNLYFNTNILENDSVDLSQVVTTYKDIYQDERYCKRKVFGKCISHGNRSKYRGTQISYDVSIFDTINSTIEAGDKITGNINKLQNGVVENKAIELKTYNPTINTSLTTANIQTTKKSTENKNIEEKEKSSINVENKLVNSDEIKLNDNEKIKQNDIKIEKQFVNSDDINLDNLKNKLVLNPIDSNYVLPTNKYSMFTTVNPNKNLDYLVESNPLYTNHSNFIGSSYFLEKLDFRGDRIIKRLGDAAYETKLVGDAIFAQRGQRSLNPDFQNENEQFVALMENAVNLSGILDLELGKPLSPYQIANLTQDIVWMEEQIVNGHKVLVPVVYLANNYDKLDGATIQAKNIDLNIKDNLYNSGTIKTQDYLNINANSITNNSGVLLSNGKATLISNDDFVNKNGGLIKGSDIQIASLNGSVINETYFDTNNLNFGRNDFTYTNLGKTSSIEATNGNLVIQAKNDITNIGANLSAKDSVFLQTQSGDINLNAIKLENGHNIYFSGGFDKAKDVEYQTSNVNANNILMQSGNNINLEASKLNADNQINLNASNDVNILALNEEYYRDKKTTTKGTFSKKTKRDMVYKESVNSSELNANDIVINANNNVNLEASKLKAEDNIVVNAKDGDVNILAKEYREGELHERSKSSFGGLKKSLDIKSTDALKLNSALLETQAANVVITSGKDINILASEINSAGDIQLKALDDVLIASQNEYLKTREIHEKSSFSLKGLTALVGTDASIYSKEIHKNDKLSSSNVASSLNANKDIVIDSGSTTIIGSNLEANNIGIKADTGEINILSSQDVENATSLDKKVELKLINAKDAITSNLKNMTSGETKLKFEVGSLTYDEVDKASQTTINNSSNLKARENIVLDSLSDINVVGSNLQAKDNLVLNSSVGDINILNTIDTLNEDIKEKHGKASVNVTVQNEYVEIGQAVKSAKESAEQLKQTKDDYSKYKGEVKKLENTLSDLKQRYKAKEVGIDYEDIEDLSDFIDNLKSQEKYYVAAIAAATADLASKTVAIATQANAAATSSGTWGFSAGISLDVNGEKSHTTNSNQTSNASNLVAKNIYINTDEKLSTNTNVIGSNVIADENLYINTNNLNVKASQDNYTSKNDSKS
ncbi:hypothetical protein CRU92_00005, partial [Arcobacter sp. FW59]